MGGLQLKVGLKRPANGLPFQHPKKAKKKANKTTNNREGNGKGKVRNPTKAQKESLLSYMDKHRHFATNRLKGKNASQKKSAMIASLAEKVNSADKDGAQRDGKKWWKCWIDLKNCAKAKAASNYRVVSTKTGGGGPDDSVSSVASVKSVSDEQDIKYISDDPWVDKIMEIIGWHTALGMSVPDELQSGNEEKNDSADDSDDTDSEEDDDDEEDVKSKGGGSKENDLSIEFGDTNILMSSTPGKVTDGTPPLASSSNTELTSRKPLSALNGLEYTSSSSKLSSSNSNVTVIQKTEEDAHGFRLVADALALNTEAVNNLTQAILALVGQSTSTAAPSVEESDNTTNDKNVHDTTSQNSEVVNNQPSSEISFDPDSLLDAFFPKENFGHPNANS